MNGVYEIMCYGDSNTWGTVAKHHISEPHRRYGRDVRWPCVLETLLGPGYAVEEEGLGGRTTIYTANPELPFKNGMHMLEGCVKTHYPLDLVILMLGTNDLHQPEPLPEDQMGVGIARMVELIQAHPEYGPEEKRAPEILLIAPPFITPSAPDARTEVYPQFFGEYGERLSRQFPQVYRAVAEKYGCHFLNAQDFTRPDPNDGVHLDAASHRRLAEAVRDKVLEISGGQA